MKFTNFSTKQNKVLAWWMPKSPYSKHDSIIADGAVRAGKSLCLSLSFILWSMTTYQDQNFAICGKTVTSCRRNVITPLLTILENHIGYSIKDSVSKNFIEISNGKVTNRYYVFGGKDEGSAALIQGVTLAGILFDEVALMPRSFVEQGLARCSVEGSKFWFNCNPEAPSHWFYEDWISKSDEKKAYYLHFTMEDNPSLSEVIKARYHALYHGVFYDRYIRGLWVAAHGIVYPMFNKDFHVVPVEPRPYEKWYISGDYGTVNPFSLGLWGLANGVWYRVDEHYYNSRETGVQLTDDEYYDALVKLAGDRKIESVIVDPSASSFITLVRRKGRFHVREADNSVIPGINNTATALKTGLIKINECCKAIQKEFTLYRWDDKAAEDRPLKENDHCLTGDTIVNTTSGDYRIDQLAGKTGEVFCYDEKENRPTTACFFDVRMTNKSAEVYEIELENGVTVRATAEHPFLTGDGWKMLKDLTDSDKVKCIGQRSGEWVGAPSACLGITSIRLVGSCSVYNMEVEKHHNFSVNGGVIVHNCMDDMRYFVRTLRIAIPKTKPLFSAWR